MLFNRLVLQVFRSPEFMFVRFLLKQSRRAACFFTAAIIVTSEIFAGFPVPANCSETQEPTAGKTFGQQYTELTRKTLLSAIELERFSLNFRLESDNQHTFRKIRYFLMQEAGSSCGLAFEIIGDDQFGKGRKRPLKVSKPALQTALKTAATGSIISASSSCFELGVNALHAFNSYRRGYDRHAASVFVASKLRQIDDLLAQRDALVAAHSDDPAQERAVIEGSILKQMRNSFVNEYSHFNADVGGAFAYQNLFFLLNAGYNTIGAVGAAAACKGVNSPKYNGPANMLFIVSGGMAALTPLLCAGTTALVRNSAYRSLSKKLNEKPAFDPDAFSTQCKKLEAVLPSSEGSLITSLPATQRLALYTQSSELFEKQLRSETRTMRALDKVALETSFLGPAIGSQLMSQGILGTVGYYRYSTQPKKQLSMFYRGAVVGTVATSMSVVGNAAWLLSSLAYEHHLSRGKKLPEQLIKARLEHLDELEKIVKTM